MDEGGPSNLYSQFHNNTFPSDETRENTNNLVNKRASRNRGRRAPIASYLFMSFEPRQQEHISALQGWMKVDEYLTGAPIRMFNKVRMTLSVFMRLCTRLKEGGALEETTNVLVEEQVMIFLPFMAQKQNIHTAQDDAFRRDH